MHQLCSGNLNLHYYARQAHKCCQKCDKFGDKACRAHKCSPRNCGWARKLEVVHLKQKLAVVLKPDALACIHIKGVK